MHVKLRILDNCACLQGVQRVQGVQPAVLAVVHEIFWLPISSGVTGGTHGQDLGCGL